jgi:hypothetical protein
MTTDNLFPHNAPHGRLVALKAYEGPFDTTHVTYREWPTGTRLIDLDGVEVFNTNESRGIRISFSHNFLPGKHHVPQDTPAAYAELSYFRAVGAQRTEFRSKSGVLELVTYDREQTFATGLYHFVAEVDGADHEFIGSFAIRYIQDDKS